MPWWYWGGEKGYHFVRLVVKKGREGNMGKVVSVSGTSHYGRWLRTKDLNNLIGGEQKFGHLTFILDFRGQ